MMKQQKTHFTLFILIFCLVAICFSNKAIAQVTFLDSSVVTNEAFYFWKADDPEPYHYGRPINPHGNCIKTYNGYVFYTWYRGGWNDRTLMLSRLKIGEGQWKHIELRWPGMQSDEPGEVQGQLSLVGGKGDTHLTANVGICPIDSTVHIMYDHHNEKLNYIRSKQGIAFAPDSEFTKEGFLPQQNYLVPGKVIDGVSYPNMFNNDAGEMFFERRLGSAVGGDIVITYYDGEKWSPEKTVISGRGGVTQGERNFCYGNPFPANGKVYYAYSPRWAESPTILGEGVYIMDLGEHMNEKAVNVDGKEYNLPVTDQRPFFIADPRSVPDHYGWAGGPQAAISPKGDIYLRIQPKNTQEYNYLRKAGEKEFTESRSKGSLGKFYGNRMYKFVETGGKLYVKSCLAGTYDWKDEYVLNIGANYDKSRIIMQDSIIAAVYRQAVNSPTVPIKSFVFKVTKSEYTPQSISFDDLAEKNEGDADFDVSVSATSGLPVVLTSSNTNIARITNNNKVMIMGVGTCEIIANQPGNGEFDSAAEVRKTLTIKANTTKQNQTIDFTLSDTIYTWSNPDQALNATATSGLAVQFESLDTAVAVTKNGMLHVKRAGVTSINALQPGNDVYNAAPIVGYELTVPIRPQEIVFEEIPVKTSADQGFQLKATSNNPNANLRFICPNNQVAIVWSDRVMQVLGAGSATITVSDEGDDYFTSAQATQTLVVEPKIHVIPAEIEAEYYNTKSGVNVTRWSNTVFYLNSWDVNDYAEYTIDVPKDTVYTIEVFAAAPGSSKKLKVVSESTTLATIQLNSTPNLTRFKGTKAGIALKQGLQTIKIVGVIGGFNFDKMKISLGGEVVPPDDDEEVPDYVSKKDYSISSVDGEQAPNVATNLFDGNIFDDARWSVNGYPKSVIIDLGEEREIIGTRMFTYQSRAYQFTIEVSNSPDEGFVQVVDRTANTSADQPISNDFDVQAGRYVKLTVTGCHNYASNWVSINELALIFKDNITGIDLLNEETDGVTVYPNPTSSGFRIDLQGIDAARVQIFEITGKKVYEENVTDEFINLSSGMYLVKVIGSNQKVYCKKQIVR